MDNDTSNKTSRSAVTGEESTAEEDESTDIDRWNGRKNVMQPTSKGDIPDVKTAPKTVTNAIKEDDNSPNEDDVPQDFFDDFSNPDFMEGLNIVDAWDDQPEEGEGNIGASKKVKEREKQLKNKVEDRKKRLRRSRSRERKRNSRDRKLPPVVSEQFGKRKSIDAKKEKPKDESDLRRDPAKSKRDLEKYKVKCDKDKEQKTITEKLKVVETGLVPPGMEMDVDIDEVLKKANQEKRKKCVELDDSWQCHPNTKQVANTVYPDLKPSAIFPSRVSPEPKKHGSKSKGKNRSSLEYATMGDLSIPEAKSGGVDRKRRSSSFHRSWHKNRSPHIEQIRPDSYTRRRKTPPPFGRVRRVLSPMALPSSSYLDKNSPLRKSNSRGRRSLSRERKRRASRSRSRNKRSSSRGPFMRRRRSRSLSEREAWIRDPKRAWRRSRSRSRSRSPKRNRYNEKKEKKMPFLEEIRLLLNNSVPNATTPTPVQTWPQNTHAQRPPHVIPIPAPIPVPVPPPNNAPSFQFPNQPHLPSAGASFDMYDQQFFIGDISLQNQPMTIVSHPIDGAGSMVLLPGMSSVPPVNTMVSVSQSDISNVHHNLVPVPPPNVPVQMPNLSIKSTRGSQSAPIDASNMALDVLAKIRSLSSQAKSNSNEEAKKLYEEKKISLSDFLSMTTNLEDTSTTTVNLPKKIQVISRCQDVMKQLDGGVLNGRFVVKHQIREASSEISNKSPLLGTPVKYKSTTSSTGMPKENFGKILTRLLSASGVAIDTVELADKEEIHVPDHPPSPPAAPQITPKKSRKSQVTSLCPITPSKYLMKMVQTDPLKCKACEERNDVIYIHSASQCSVSVRTIATQTEDPVKDMLKNKSLASLTPAQLLSKEKERENHVQPSSDEMRSSGINHDRFGKPIYRDGRSPPGRSSFSPARTQFSPPRNPFGQPQRGHYSPPRRYASPPKHERSGIYVPTGPPILPKRHYPPEPFSGPNMRPPFTDSADRYFRR